jgi:SSS family solute:Na+ symporter
VAVTYLLSLLEPRQVFKVGVWCFTGFSSLFPLVFASIYWRRTTAAGAVASVLTAAISWLVLFAMSGFGQTYLLLGSWKVLPVAVTFTLAAVALVAVSLATRPIAPERLAPFFPGGVRTRDAGRKVIQE